MPVDPLKSSLRISSFGYYHEGLSLVQVSSLQVTETGPRDVANAACPAGWALLCLSTYSILVDKIETWLVSTMPGYTITIQYNTISFWWVHPFTRLVAELNLLGLASSPYETSTVSPFWTYHLSIWTYLQIFFVS